MQVSLEKTGNIAHKMTVVVPSDRVQVETDKRLAKLAKTVKIDGFRPGKVPLKVVKSRYQDSVFYEVVDKVINETLQEALGQEKVVPAAVPDIEPKNLELGKDLEYVADFDIYPTFSKFDLDGVKVKRATAKADAKDVQRTIDNIRKQQVEWKEVKRKSKDGDRVLIDFEGSIDGELFPGGKSDDFPVVLGEGQMLPDFEKGLKGVKGGEEKTIKVKFPKDYQGEEVAGKTAEFSLKIHSVSEAELPEVDEEFVKKFQVDSVEKFTDDVKSNLEQNVETQLQSTNRVRVLDALMDNNDADIPRKMVQDEIGRIIESQKEQMKQRGMPTDDYNPNPEALEPDAKRRVGLGLVLVEVIEKNEIKVDQEKVKAYIEKMASSYEDPSMFVEFYMNDPKAKQQVESVVLENQVVDYLLETATVSDEKVSVEDLLNGNV